MNVLIYDGDCNMCSRLIRFVVKINRNRHLFITDFNSEWTQNNIEIDERIDSLVYVRNREEYIYSDAVIHLLMDTRKLFRPFVILKVIPKQLRDAAYRWIARNRKRIFSSDSCEMPSEEFKKMYLE